MDNVNKNNIPIMEVKSAFAKRDEKGYPLLENGEIDWELLSFEKERVRDQYERFNEGSNKKPHRKHATNYTPPKKRNRK